MYFAIRNTLRIHVEARFSGQNITRWERLGFFYSLVTSIEGKGGMLKSLMALLLFMLPLAAIADWASVPDLESRVLWKLVADGRAKVVSSVSFGEPSSRHLTRTVFKILKATKEEGPIKWAVEKDGTYRPVMCKEVWINEYTYSGSACSIPGCTPSQKECLNEIEKNL